jgi:hypothetical protein
MKTILAVLFAVLAFSLSVFSGLVISKRLNTDEVSLPAVGTMVFGLLSYLLWKSRPNALWRLDGRKMCRTYWWVPTPVCQKFLLERLVQRRGRVLRSHAAHPLTFHLSRLELRNLQTELMIYTR